MNYTRGAHKRYTNKKPYLTQRARNDIAKTSAPSPRLELKSRNPSSLNEMPGNKLKKIYKNRLRCCQVKNSSGLHLQRRDHRPGIALSGRKAKLQFSTLRVTSFFTF